MTIAKETDVTPPPGSLSGKQFAGPSLRRFTLLFSSMLMLATILYALPALPVMAVPVRLAAATDQRGFTGVDGKWVSAGAPQGVRGVVFPMDIKPNTQYRISYNLEVSSAKVDTVFITDFYAGPEYDSPKQEFTLPVTKGMVNHRIHASQIIDSGTSPERADLRLFYADDARLAISNLQVVRYSPLYNAAKVLLAGLLVLLCGLGIYWVRPLNPVLSHALAAAAVVAVVCSLVVPMGTGDTMWNVPTAISLLSEGNADLDEYADLIQQRQNYGIVVVDQKDYNYFPIGMSVLATPFIIVSNLLVEGDLAKVEVLSAHMIFVLITFLFFYLIHSLTRRIWLSYLMSGLFAFATSNFHLLSGALWTHGGVQLMLVTALLFIVVGEKRGSKALVQFSAIPLAVSYMIRPTSALAIVGISVYVLLKHRHDFVYFAAVGMSMAVAFFGLSYRAFGTVLPPYYAGTRLEFGTFLEAFVGQSFSPNRGLFIFMPMFLFASYGIYYAYRRRDTLLLCVAGVVGAYLLFTAMFPHWWGGFSYGPRILSDIIPLLLLLLIDPLTRIDFGRRSFYSIAFAVAVALSLFIQFRGATDKRVHEWSAVPTSVDVQPERIWNWHDMQFMRGL